MPAASGTPSERAGNELVHWDPDPHARPLFEKIFGAANLYFPELNSARINAYNQDIARRNVCSKGKQKKQRKSSSTRPSVTINNGTMEGPKDSAFCKRA